MPCSGLRGTTATEAAGATLTMTIRIAGFAGLALPPGNDASIRERGWHRR
jgi:hypothetical protein